MIIIDFSGIAVANIIVQKMNDESMIRHMILNSIRMYRKKFKDEYGTDIVLACDAGNNWRRQYYPQYKANRKKSRDESTFDWNKAWSILTQVREEIKENFPYKLIHEDGCEADDIIGTLVEHTQQFGQYQKVMIVSADGDFKQLQKYDNVSQFSPLTKKYVEETHPRQNLKLKILQGDAGDGIPNVLSHDDTFVNGERQTPLSKKKKLAILEDLSEGELLYAASWYRNYQRNEKLIDLTQTPQNLKHNIINEYEHQEPSNNTARVLPYLINKNCKMLIESVEEFIK
jgi:5'-3' exonuclease|tara:strand:- start:101 stop:958 length:858 start_codon:yes stop_codon:yes gene_type:complete